MAEAITGTQHLTSGFGRDAAHSRFEVACPRRILCKTQRLPGEAAGVGTAESAQNRPISGGSRRQANLSRR